MPDRGSVTLRYSLEEGEEIADWLESEHPFDKGAMDIVRDIRKQLPVKFEEDDDDR